MAQPITPKSANENSREPGELTAEEAAQHLSFKFEFKDDTKFDWRYLIEQTDVAQIITGELH